METKCEKQAEVSLHEIQAKELVEKRPCELSMTDLSTCKQIIQYYYLHHASPSSDLITIVRKICENVIYLWCSVNHSLLLITEKSNIKER